MKTINKIKSTVIYLEEDEMKYLGGTYDIYRLTSSGCKISVPVLSGDILSNSILIDLEDGSYQIEFSKSGYVNTEDILYIYKGFLSTFVCEIQNNFCCNCCGDTKDLKELFYTTSLTLNCLNLLPHLPLYNKVSCNERDKYMTDKRHESYFGTSNFKTDDSIKNLLMTLYSELYFNQLNNLRDTETELGEIDNMFKYKAVKECFYKNGFNIDEMACQIKNLNCNCNG